MSERLGTPAAVGPLVGPQCRAITQLRLIFLREEDASRSM